MSEQARFLVIGQEEGVESNITSVLEWAGYQVTKATDTYEGIRAICRQRPDVIIIDEGKMQFDRESTYTSIRRTSYLPIISIGRPENIAEALEFGADVYISKPPDHRELMARIQNLLKNKISEDPRAYSMKKESTTTENPQRMNDRMVSFDVTEFHLALLFIRNKDRLVPISQIIEEVWEGGEISTALIDEYIHRIELKLSTLFSKNIVLSSFGNLGYKLEETG